MPTFIRYQHHQNLSRDFLCKALSALYGKLTKPGKLESYLRVMVMRRNSGGSYNQALWALQFRPVKLLLNTLSVRPVQLMQQLEREREREREKDNARRVTLPRQAGGVYPHRNPVKCSPLPICLIAHREPSH